MTVLLHRKNYLVIKNFMFWLAYACRKTLDIFLSLYNKIKAVHLTGCALTVILDQYNNNNNNNGFFHGTQGYLTSHKIKTHQ